jgi:hypothetical protein
MPEQSVSRGKYNFNKHQKEKQNKIMQYYRRSFKSQLAPVREITRPRRTRKQHFQSNPNTSKLTKTHTLEYEKDKDKKDKEQEKQDNKEKLEHKEHQEHKKNLEKSEKSEKSDKVETTKSPTQKGGENQYVIMD